MIKEWFYEAVIDGKKYRVNCVESNGYGGSRMRTQTLTLIEEASNEKTLRVLKKPKEEEDVEERTETTSPH